MASNVQKKKVAKNSSDLSVDGLGGEKETKDIYFVAGEISRSLYSKLSEMTATEKCSDKAIVFLVTFGGDAHAAFRMGRCLRDSYSNLRIVIPSFCKSAGTILAVAADELGVGDLGELGPLDVQLRKNSEFAEVASGLDTLQGLKETARQTQEIFRRLFLDIRLGSGISTALAGKFASEMAVGLGRPLMEKIDLLSLGETVRAMQVAYVYGERLNEYGNNLKEDGLSRLSYEYPSHGFVIDRKEARTIFKRVTDLTEMERNICAQLGESMLVPPDESVVINLRKLENELN